MKPNHIYCFLFAQTVYQGIYIGTIHGIAAFHWPYSFGLTRDFVDVSGIDWCEEICRYDKQSSADYIGIFQKRMAEIEEKNGARNIASQ